MRSVDVAVVGSGPAGSTCALHLARAGLRVAVVEKTEPPRYKTCGGGLVLRGRNLVDFDLASVVEHECRAAEMYLWDSDLHFRVDRDEPLVSMTMRSDLDRKLIESALDAGANLVTPCEVLDVEVRRGEVFLRTNGDGLRAGYVVAADGVLSRTARAAGWEENPHRIPAVESEIRVPASVADRFRGVARFDFGFPNHGYAWVFPKRDHLSVGCLSTVRGAKRLRRTLDEYVARLGLGRIESREDHGFVIPVAPRAATLARGRVLLTGDAAGLPDPVTCEGISNAMASGLLAARALAGHLDGPRAACDAYQRGLAREILSDLRAARFLARLLYDRGALARAVIRRVGRPLCEAVAEVIAGRRRYRRLLYHPRSYWRLLAS